MSVDAVVCYLTRRDYGGLLSPYHPPERYPELSFLPRKETAPGNSIYAGVRRVLAGMGLDGERFGRPDWNPLGSLVRPGQTVVIKPNLVTHFNDVPGEGPESMVTHGSVLRPLIDYAWKALSFKGRVVVADAPIDDCDIEVVKCYLGVESLCRFYKETLGLDLEFLDLRRRSAHRRDGIIVTRETLPGDPHGYCAVDLNGRSTFASAPSLDGRVRGSDYDVEETASHHSKGKHEYFVSRTILGADLVISVPKMKTHRKAGVTLALKNLVGINGDKNWLPHYTAGFPEDGGDEYPKKTAGMALRHWVVERCRPWLNRARFLTAFRLARRIERRSYGSDFLRAGNWYGNDTVWRMVLDLNHIFYYSDREGTPGEDRFRGRASMTILDGVVAGEGHGPISSVRKPLGVIAGAVDPIALDLAAVEIMGFDWRKIPKIVRAMEQTSARLTEVAAPEDVEVIEIDLRQGGGVRRCGLAEIGLRAPFRASPGWVGHIEEQVRGLRRSSTIASEGATS